MISAIPDEAVATIRSEGSSDTTHPTTDGPLSTTPRNVSLNASDAFFSTINLQRQDHRPTLLDHNIRDLAIKTLANDFLNVADADLDLRAYMIETTLPTLVCALEQLLGEVIKRAQNNGEDLMKVMRPKTSKPDIHVDELGPQADKPAERLDSINWLAQYLYRNNPRFSNFSSAQSSPYLQSMTAVTTQLKARLFELETTRRAQLRAEEMQKRQEEERSSRVKSAQLAERNKDFRELLSTAFRKWVGRLWRASPGFLLQHEVMDAYRKVFSTDAMQANPDFFEKLNALIAALRPTSPPPGGATAAATSFPISTNGKWAHDEFVNTHLRLTPTWTLEELSSFLRELGTHMDAAGDNLKQTFSESFYMPSLRLPQGAGRDAWVSRLGEVVEQFVGGGGRKENEEEDEEGGEGVALVDPERVAELWTAFWSATGEGGGGAAGASGGSGIPDAEAAYRQFAKQLISTLGAPSFCSLMAHIRRTFELEEQRRDADAAAAAAATLNRHDELRVLLAPLGTSAQQTGGKGIALLSYNGALELAIERNSNPELESVLESCKLLRRPKTAPGLGDGEESDTDKTAHVSEMEVLDLILERCRSLNEEAFAAMLDTLKEGIKDQLEKENIEREKAAEAAAEEEARKKLEEAGGADDNSEAALAQKRAEERKRMEQEALAQVRAMALDPTLTVGTATAKAAELLAATLNAIHQPGTPTAEDTSATFMAAPTFTSRAAFLEPTDTPSLSQLRVIASTQAGDTGTILQPEDFEYGVLETGSSMHEEEGAWKFGVAMAAEGFSGVLLFSTSSLPADQKLGKEDQTFIRQATKTLQQTLSAILTRDAVTIFAKAAQQWIASHHGVQVELFLPQKIQLDGETVDWYRVKDIGKGLESIVSSSDWLRPASSQWERVQEEDETDPLKRAAVHPSSPHSTDSALYLPLSTEATSNGTGAAGILKLTRIDPNTPLPDPAIDPVLLQTLAIFGQAVKYQLNPQQLSAGQASAVPSLAADDQIHTPHILFHKLLLAEARRSIAQIDSKALSELRSYRKPPVTVHRVVKGVLYLFGKVPKEVSTWQDCCRLLTMDLLKAMLEYDPTAVQKKIRFKRVKRVLKTISRTALASKASVPAHTMWSWLTVSVSLRDEAVKRRKSRPVTAEAEEEEDAEGEEEEEGEVEGGDAVGEDEAVVADGEIPPETSETPVEQSVSVSGGGLPVEDEAVVADGETPLKTTDAPVEQSVSVSGGGLPVEETKDQPAS
ncbi:hypothetical protein DFS34DRAFT_626735 [Phlyctochytrium arcticum]|nr:hypothetical protein DFS34DRAFT_626735 [Phlyctochytrium arcticum]